MAKFTYEAKQRVFLAAARAGLAYHPNNRNNLSGPYIAAIITAGLFVWYLMVEKL